MCIGSRTRQGSRSEVSPENWTLTQALILLSADLHREKDPYYPPKKAGNLPELPVRCLQRVEHEFAGAVDMALQHLAGGRRIPLLTRFEQIAVFVV